MGEGFYETILHLKLDVTFPQLDLRCCRPGMVPFSLALTCLVGQALHILAEFVQ